MCDSRKAPIITVQNIETIPNRCYSPSHESTTEAAVKNSINNEHNNEHKKNNQIINDNNIKHTCIRNGEYVLQLYFAVAYTLMFGIKENTWMSESNANIFTYARTFTLIWCGFADAMKNHHENRQNVIYKSPQIVHNFKIYQSAWFKSRSSYSLHHGSSTYVKHG